MSFSYNFPMTLREMADELDAIGINLMVYRAQVEYDQHMAGFDIEVSLECRAIDIRPDEDTPEDAFDRAMKILGP